ncbi:hypothetical protein [Brevundimonas sp. TWP2-3-4b1]|uniref:hypothetical protein n=1 Tax=Brevundimonas sp. TWP2-3-4b1 TaxID=2804580 RepID=UPI003CF2B063
MSHFPTLLRGGVISVGALLGVGCTEGGVDSIRDPQQKAEFNCRYVLERALATPEERSADDVLRRQIAVFAAPAVQRENDQVRFTWPAGSITRLGTGSSHQGACVMEIGDGQQRLVSASLDGRTLHSGFSF